MVRDTSKVCARCGKRYVVDDPLFITCPLCRVPLPDSTERTGCHRWVGVRGSGDAPKAEFKHISEMMK